MLKDQLKLFTLKYLNFITQRRVQVSSEITSVINGSSGGEGEASASASGIEITIDERLNYLIVKATKSELDFISKIISEVDVRTKQILIEAFIVEASEDLGKALGATFGITAPRC